MKRAGHSRGELSLVDEGELLNLHSSVTCGGSLTNGCSFLSHVTLGCGTPCARQCSEKLAPTACTWLSDDTTTSGRTETGVRATTVQGSEFLRNC